MSDARDTITLAHGGGGRATRSLIEGTILRYFGKSDPKGLRDHSELSTHQDIESLSQPTALLCNHSFFQGVTSAN